jgi:hypothetical protein
MSATRDSAVLALAAALSACSEAMPEPQPTGRGEITALAPG